MSEKPDGEAPCYVGNDYIQWRIPAWIWDGHRYPEDVIRVTLDYSDGDWYAITEVDQSDKRDLTEAELADVRKAFHLDAWVQYYNPEYARQKPSP